MENKREIIRKNIDYLLQTKNETKVSLSDGAGINRTTIYNILDGKVVRIQENTLRKVANFFGVSFTEIQSVDLKDKERSERQISFDGNKNPIAIPVINDTTILSSMNSKIGKMIVYSSITYYFSEGSNIIGIILSKGIDGYYDKGDLVIVKRFERMKNSNCIAVKSDGELFVLRESVSLPSETELVGSILEERYGGKY